MSRWDPSVGIPKPSRSRIVLAGTATYTFNDELPNLPSVKNNVNDLEDIFCDRTHGVVSRENCKVLLDVENAFTLGKELIDAARGATDLLLFYYAGHGIVHDGQLLLSLSGSCRDYIQISSFPWESVKNAFRESSATTRAIILDCCFSGIAADAGMSLVQQETIKPINGTLIISSTSPTMLALAPIGARNTAFSGRLIRFLRDGLPTGGPFITFDDLYNGLDNELRTAGLPAPRRLSTGTVSSLVFVRNRWRSHSPHSGLAGMKRQDVIRELVRSERVTDLVALWREDFPGAKEALADVAVQLDRFDDEAWASAHAFSQSELVGEYAVRFKSHRRLSELDRLVKAGYGFADTVILLLLESENPELGSYIHNVPTWIDGTYLPVLEHRKEIYLGNARQSYVSKKEKMELLNRVDMCERLITQSLLADGDFEALSHRTDPASLSAYATHLATSGQVGALRSRADNGDQSADWALAEMLGQGGDVMALRNRAQSGSWAAESALVRHYELDSAALKALAADGFRAANQELVRLACRTGDIELLQGLADDDVPGARDALVEIAINRGDEEGLFRMADAGWHSAVDELLNILVERIDLNGLTRLERSAPEKARTARLEIQTTLRLGSDSPIDDPPTGAFA